MSLDHLISIRDFEYREAFLLPDAVERMVATQSHRVRKFPTLRGRTVVSLFFGDPARTRISFEATAKYLSADTVSFSTKDSSLSKDESLKDTVLTLQAMGIDAVVVRHLSSGATHRLARAGWMRLPVLNAGDGTHQCPTQALLDTMTPHHHYKRDPSLPEVKPLTSDTDLEGTRIVVVGNALHSRVVRSNVDLLTLLGVQVTLAAPPTLLPVGIEDQARDVDYDLDHALASEPDAVMMPRVQREHMSAVSEGLFLSPNEYHATYGLNRQCFEELVKKTIVTHPGSMNRGLEISTEAADSPHATVIGQVSNDVSARMAALYLLLAPEEHFHS